MNPAVLITLVLVGAAVLAGYAVARAMGTPHRDTLLGVRAHGFVTALAALFFTTFTGVSELMHQTVPANGGVSGVHPDGWMTVAVHADVSWLHPAVALVPAVLVTVIYCVTQLTFPTPTESVRRASLTPRVTGRLLPRGLTVFAALMVLLLTAALLLLAREPSTPMILAPADQWGTEDPELLAHRATAAGAEIVPWILLALAATVACVAVSLVAITRRRAVEGLSAAEDRAAREVAANRLLRTGVWMLWLLVAGTWGAVSLSRTARDVLAHYVPAHPAALASGAGSEWIGVLDEWIVPLHWVLIVVLLLWRSPALRVLRPAREAPATSTPRPAGEPA